MPKQTSPQPVLAAGAVLWRPGPEGSSRPEVAVIHRPRYDDWSLPKGKVDPGETLAVTAVREIHEETGYHAELGRRLMSVSYPVDEGTKHVQYWAARATDGEFRPNHEVDKLLWLPVEDALTQVKYQHDQAVLQQFTELPADTRTVLIVRHATAGQKSKYRGDDRKRPLDKHGRAQAESLVGLLLAFGARELHAADRVRCHQTIAPLADELGVAITNEPTLTEESYAENPKSGRARVLEIAALPGTRVLCTQGKVIPDLISWWCATAGITPESTRNKKGSVWILSLAGEKLVAADHVESPLALR
ncbi:NUDIX hydrolase [[Mycobacterium] wendilense]|uniref:NUDIX hydrolase n=1 Tax=[Mycobacterium] wendilense TaxID=3064284 RepID=A0ABM9MFU9_9MYCO|nr:NUDIX hydrolase [Mycolicibacterium sp. MU0050]CAJ1584086.1 NUDIX hydrolase [Mycolicibacterium sp. MU0050]